MNGAPNSAVDEAFTRYAPADQISPHNVDRSRSCGVAFLAVDPKLQRAFPYLQPNARSKDVASVIRSRTVQCGLVDLTELFTTLLRSPRPTVPKALQAPPR